MAEIVPNPIPEIYERFRQKILEAGVVTEQYLAFGSSDVGAKQPWIAFKPMTNYTWLQARDLSNNECGLMVNVQIECFAKTESKAMMLEDACKAVMFNMGFDSSGFNQRFKNNNIHRYISRYELTYTGEVYDLSDTPTTPATNSEVVADPNS